MLATLHVDYVYTLTEQHESKQMTTMTSDLIAAFLTSGRATGTLKSLKSGSHFTFKISANRNDEHMFFVSLLTGSDNEHDYSYLGLLLRHPERGTLSFRVTGKSCAGNDAASVRGFRWMLAKLNRGEELSPQGEFHHEGRCGRCNRVLTEPESIETGLGPVCREKMAAGL